MMKLNLSIFIVLICTISIYAQITNIRLIPIMEGWAKNSINTVIFRKNAVTSFRSNQFAAFYDENSKVVVAKRKLGQKNWEIKPTNFVGNTKDAHNSISLAIDGRGFLHLAWNQHNSPLQYVQSLKAETLEFSEYLPMLSEKENNVTYPEFYNLPDGNLLLLYRDGGSGNGNLVLNFYNSKTQKWSRIQENLIDGEGKRNAYPQMTIDVKGTIHLSWVWRETPNVATNHDLCYAKSNDNGKTWQKSSGEKYILPINAENAEYVWRIPQNSELINQTSMTTDLRGNPYIATYWRDEKTNVPQFHVVYFDRKSWKMSQISTRKAAFSLSGAGTKRIPVSSPQIVVNKDKIIVIFRDEERKNRISVAVSENIKENLWKVFDLSEIEVGMWEPTFDQNLWNQKKELHFFVQKVGQGDGEKLENILPQMISILEWKP